MKKIMIVTNSLTGGGAERAMNLITHELSKNFNVVLVPINAGHSDLIAPAAKVLQIERKWRGGFFGTLTSFMKFIRISHLEKPDIIILNCALPELFGCFLPLRSKTLVIEHVNFPFQGREKLGRIIRKISRARGFVYASVSEHLKIWPQNLEPSFVLKNLVNFDFVASSQNLLKVNVSELVFIGRFSNPQKRPEMLLNIAKETKLPLKMIGDGPMKDELLHMATTLGVQAEFLGHVSNPWSYLNPGSLLIVPSAYEGDGLVAIEALHMNVPMLLSSIVDFRRFNLPDFFYCSSVSDYVSKIKNSQHDVNTFSIPEEHRKSVTYARRSSIVSQSWNKMLDELI